MAGQPVLRAAEAIEALEATGTAPTRHRLTRRHQGAAGGFAAEAVDPAAVRGRDGREPVRPCRTHLPKCEHFRRSAKA